MRSTYKWFALVLAVIMIFTAAACRKTGPETPDTPDVTEAPAVIPAGTFSFPVGEIDAAEAELAKLIDLSKYERTLMDENTGLRFTIKDENYVPHNFLKSVKLSDGNTYTLPFNAAELEAAGWLPTSDYPDLAANAEETVNADLVNAAGEIMAVTLENSEEETKAWNELQVVEISFYPNLDDITFDIGGMKNDSTIEDVINALGAPDGVDFYDASSMYHGITFYYDEPDEDDFLWDILFIYFSAETNTLDCVSIDID